MGQARPFRKATVLVVENDEEERFLVSMLFEESDLDVIACDNAETAAAIMAEKPGEIAIVFADMRLGGKMDGVDLARTVSRKYPGVSVIVTAQHHNKRLEQLPARAEFVQKPWLALDLLRKAERLRAAWSAS
jgi:DNA-binding NtrC family response regulator